MLLPSVNRFLVPHGNVSGVAGRTFGQSCPVPCRAGCLNASGKNSSALTPESTPKHPQMHVLSGVVNFRSIKACGHLPTTFLVCPIHTLTFAHSTNRRTSTFLPHDNNDPFDLTHCPLPIFKMRSSSRPAHRHPSYSHRTPSRPHPHFAFLRAPSAMFSTFNIIRASVYFSVFICSIICLAIAAHFQSVLSASDLTRFVPFAIFVSSATLAIILVLSAFSVRRNMNPVSTRIELGCLGLMGTFWIALGAFLASSDSETADVECFVSATDLTPIDGRFSTETYQAQYRVLEAFSLINAILILGFLLLLFILALGHQRKGHKDIWYSPVNALDGSGNDSKKASKLPAPVTARRSHSQSKPQYTQYTPTPKRHVSEKRTHAHRPSQSRQPQPQMAYAPERRAHRSRPTERYRPDYYARDASPRR